MSKKEKDNAPAKTNAARLLDKAGIKYELIPYPVDENHLSAVEVAEQIGEDIKLVWRPQRAFRMRGAWRRGNRFESGGKDFSKQESRVDTCERLASSYRLHKGRLFPCGHEKAVPDIFSIFDNGTRVCLRECRAARAATENRAFRFGGLHKGKAVLSK